MTTQPDTSRSHTPSGALLSPHERRLERLRCATDAAYFLFHYVTIESPETRRLLPFDLWPAQEDALQMMQRERRLVVLKARQLGLTWLALSHALWLMLFRPPAHVLLFSLRESEARELLRRLRGLHSRLPPWLRGAAGGAQSGERWSLGNGSRALAFSTRAGRSYTGTLAIVDEADHVPHLADFLNAVKPTVDGGGQLLLISTADKSQPQSTFKRLFRAG
ncbi:MAG: terminase large subunit domain-containing protein, partial [Caldilineaceae bacterium]